MSKKFKELTDKMSVESRARVKSSLKKEVKKLKKLKKPRLKTVQVLHGLDYCFRITQEFIPGEQNGHYLWFLVDKKGDILKTGGSSGQAPAKLSAQEIYRLGNQVIDRYEFLLKIIS